MFINIPGTAPVKLGAGSEGLISRVSAEAEDICRFRREIVANRCWILRALGQPEEKLRGQLNGARMAIVKLYWLQPRKTRIDRLSAG